MCKIRSFNQNFEDFRRNAAEKSICCEIVAGHVVKSLMTGEEGRKLCFMLGTLLEDYMVIRRKEDQVCFGPVDIQINESNIYQPDLVTFESSSDEDEGNIENRDIDYLPKMVIEILSADNAIYDCLDKAVMYRNHGVKEYWLIDLNEQFVYTYGFRQEFDYKRYSFEQNIRSQSYPGFECCISDIMWSDGGSLKELALFYRFKQEIYPDSMKDVVAEAGSSYIGFDDEQYTAEAFYEWMAARKNVARYTSMVELLFGNIREYAMPAFRHQNIRGNLYFVIKSFLKTSGLPYQLQFAPIAVEFKKLDLLDSVVVPDLFLINRGEVIYDNIYRGVPEWVIEIVSPATAAQDYIDKAQLYQYHGVGEYWVVNDWKQQVMVLRYNNEKGDSEDEVESVIYGFEETIPVCSLPGLTIRMEEVLNVP